MKDYILAAQLYTLHDLLKDKSEEEVRDVLRQVKAMGYDAIQISGIGDITKEIADMYKQISNDLNLDICATHTNLHFIEDNLEWVIEYHQLWQCKYVGIGAMPEEFKSPTGIIEFAEKCNDLGKKLKEHNLIFIYHNHKFEFEKYNGQTMMDILFEAFDPNYVEFELDTYWVQAGGENPVKWIKKLDGRMSVVHFKDFRIINDEQQFAEIGEGNLNWSEITKACETTRVKYAAVEQDSFTDDPLGSIKMSIDFLMK